MHQPAVGPYRCHSLAYREYDPRACEVAQQIAGRIVAWLPAVSVEHIGSTAVPGCAGKGIVDLMVLYPDGELQAAKDALRALGFQRQTRGHIHPETRPMRVGSFEHAGRTYFVHAHVLAASSPEVEQLRLFRDRLRADPCLAAQYMAQKRAILTSGVADPAVYTQQKAAFIQGVIDGAPAALVQSSKFKVQGSSRSAPVPGSKFKVQG